MSPRDEPLVVIPGEGTVVSTRGGVVLADAAATGGTLGLVESRMPPGRWVPAHLHRREAEAWYVLEGELTFRFGDRTAVAPAGAFVFSPPGVAHSYGNAGERPARFLVLFVPGGFEGALVERAAREGTLPPVELDEETRKALGRKYGTERV
jgi:quercetin dioxygenase-like cupin family protein